MSTLYCLSIIIIGFGIGAFLAELQHYGWTERAILFGAVVVLGIIGGPAWLI